MPDLSETDPERSADDQQLGHAAATRRRRVDGRTIATVVVVALVGAVASALIASALIGKDGSRSGFKASPTKSGAIALSPTKVDGPKLAETALLTETGKPTTLADTLGEKPALVNLWSQSCGPCVDEMPLLERVHTGDARVDVIGVNTDAKRQQEAARRLAARTGISYPWVRDPSGEFAETANAAGLPTTLLVGPDGTVLAAQTGVFHSQSEIRTWLDRNLP